MKNKNYLYDYPFDGSVHRPKASVAAGVGASFFAVAGFVAGMATGLEPKSDPCSHVAPSEAAQSVFPREDVSNVKAEVSPSKREDSYPSSKTLSPSLN